MAYYFRKIKFETLNQVLRLLKTENHSEEQVLSYFDDPLIKQQIKASYHTLMPVEIRDVLKWPNAEQRMIGMSIFAAEEIIVQLKAKLVDEQTIDKKQIRWNASLQPYEYTYKDTYALYAIEGSQLGVQSNRVNSTAVPTIYMVQCTCTSTGRTFYHYVPVHVGRSHDAIEAIAWTFTIGGQHLTKRQYLSYMYSET